jgi:hypothetical protein
MYSIVEILGTPGAGEATWGKERSELQQNPQQQQQRRRSAEAPQEWIPPAHALAHLHRSA